jgi:L-rhamnose isomerase
MVMQEEAKMLPFGAVWAEYCERCGVASDLSWFEEIKKYEKDVLFAR